MEMFPMDSVPELNTKKLGNSSSFLVTTHTPLFTKRFRSYGIQTIYDAAEFCFWIEQWLKRSSVFSLGLAETPEVLNTVSVGNSLRFPMVYKTAPNS
jgi:hypothetical protein